MQDEIHRTAYRHQLDIEAGSRIVVGVNAYQDDDDGARGAQPDYSALETRQRNALVAMKTERDAASVDTALRSVVAAARSGDNLMPPLIDAVKALATLGEISDVLRAEWGTHDGS